MQRQKRTTHAAVSRFVASVLPPKENDVPRLYHVPRNPRYDPETAVVEQIVLSVTPTPGVYASIGYSHDEGEADPPAPTSNTSRKPPRTLCFLHRPFTLDRRRVRKGTLVVSSHTAFDEVLTVGWNTALAERLGVDVSASVCVQGYKGDPERKIGLVGGISTSRDALLGGIYHEFGSTELIHEGASEAIRVVAIMNAFNEDEVHRVLDIARQQEWIAEDGNGVLYLTGQPRALGLQTAKTFDMSVACVGHRQAEDWGIRYMATQLRTTFPGVHIEEVYEEEIPVIRERKQHVVVGEINH